MFSPSVRKFGDLKVPVYIWYASAFEPADVAWKLRFAPLVPIAGIAAARIVVRSFVRNASDAVT